MASTTRNAHGRTASAAYAAELRAARALVRRLETYIARHAAEQLRYPQNWGYVGDMAHIAGALAIILARA